MNVLLIEFDLYKSVGGGQTVYKRLIESNPKITFFYFGVREEAAAIRPANARLVPHQVVYPFRSLTGEFTALDLPVWAHLDYLGAANMAASVAHLSIDVVDIPDYKYFGYFLAPALRRHGQKHCKIVVALHGNLSETQRVNWSSHDVLEISVDQREQWQYRTADSRYGISRDYLDHWQSIAGVAGHYLHPLRFLSPPKILKWNRTEAGVSLNFIGRTEGFKGPDLFVELLTWLPAKSYQTARIIGPGVVDAQGVSSTVHLQRMAARRGLQIQHHACMTKGELAEIYSGRGLTVLPSRMDTFNLTALESFYAGCPVAVSGKAGVCRFMRDTYPEIPFATLDVDRLHSSGPVLLKLIDDYDRQRDKLTKAMESAEPLVTGLDLQQIYESGDTGEVFLKQQAESLYDRVAAFYHRNRISAGQRIAAAGVRGCDALRNHLEGFKGTGQVLEQNAWPLHRQLFYLPEGTPQEINRKTGFAADITRAVQIDRARGWAELARLERVRGNDFVAATYEIRIMRALGEDRSGMLPWVMAILNEQGYPQEAKTVLALYGPREQRLERSRELLTAAHDNHRQVPDRPYQFIADGRTTQTPKVGIIVSLYKAANKLETFLRMLSQQEWVMNGQAELVFVDSHSPTNEYEVFQRMSAALGIKAVYARTEERETIQKAWNRGILLARAPYLSFLGVDEMVRPDCLSVLAGELDADPALDWVQGNSVITEVNPQGTLLRDVMIYQRIPYEQDLVYLETCYLSWVGGMYRKSIHDRCGYYDESFGAAGDTEFKNRVLPFIKSKTVPQTLGVFLNYPEERTTQSPRAEVEDLRAWYLHRSVAGVEYALARRKPEEALTLLKKTLGYRKSYCGHQSTDLEYAQALALFAAPKLPGQKLDQVVLALGRALQGYRELEWLPVASPRSGVRELKRVQQLAVNEARIIQSCLDLGDSLPWLIFNDNRYEQHAQPWEGKALAEHFLPEERCCWMRTKEPVAAALVQPGDDTAKPAVPDPDKMPGKLLAVLREQVDQFRKVGKLDVARDLGVLVQFFQDLAEGKDAPVTNASGTGPILCRILAENNQGKSLGNTALFDRNFAGLCALLAEIATPICVELGDIFEGLATLASQNLEQNRAMELAARLLTYPSPTEAVRRHSADLDRKVLETLKRAATTAKANGNAAYCLRLETLSVAIQTELVAKESRKPMCAVA